MNISCLIFELKSSSLVDPGGGGQGGRGRWRSGGPGGRGRRWRGFPAIPCHIMTRVGRIGIGIRILSSFEVQSGLFGPITIRNIPGTNT